MRRGCKAFCTGEDGSSTIQFVLMFLAFVSVMTFVVQAAIYLYAVTSIQKAAEAGVRMAVVSRPVVGSAVLLDTIGKSGGHDFGERCKTPLASGNSAGGDPCVRFAEQACGPGKGGCDGPFNDILSEMRGYNGNIQRSNVTVTYTDVGIGFAGGSRRPMITVTVSGVDFNGGLFGLLLSFASNAQPGRDFSNMTLPPAIASMPAESLGQ
jgi:hypothetical protein